MVSAIFGIGGGIGLPLSGVVVDVLDTRWLFWVNLVSLPAAFAAYRLLAADADHGAPADRLARRRAAVRRARRDPARRLRGRRWGWGSPANVGADPRRPALAGVFLRVEARAADPLIDLAVLRRPASRRRTSPRFMVGLAMFASFLLIPQFAQAPELTGYGFGASVTVAGPAAAARRDRAAR